MSKVDFDFTQVRRTNGRCSHTFGTMPGVEYATCSACGLKVNASNLIDIYEDLLIEMHENDKDSFTEQEIEADRYMNHVSIYLNKLQNL